MYHMELKNHIELLKYLVIYIKKSYIFLALFPRFTLITHIVARYIFVCKIYSCIGTPLVLLVILKLRKLIAIKNDTKRKETFLL